MGFVWLVLLASLAAAQGKLQELSCKQIRELVDGHNSRRLLLAKGQVSGQPAASQMNAILWDEELAAKAAKWASKYQWSHNPDKSIGSGRFNTGENLYWYSTTAKNYKLGMDAALKSWFDEHKDFTFKTLASSDFGREPQIGHYTQMAWSQTIYLGCAVSQKLNNKGWTEFYVVCNYGPAGNYIGQTPYRPGNPSGRLSCGAKNCTNMYGSRCRA